MLKCGEYVWMKDVHSHHTSHFVEMPITVFAHGICYLKRDVGYYGILTIMQHNWDERYNKGLFRF